MANIKNADCSEIVPSTAVSLKPATGYTVLLADMADQTKACHFLFLVSFNGYLPATSHDRFTPFRNSSRSRLKVPPIPRRLPRLPTLPA
jgi:hypothetical protein